MSKVSTVEMVIVKTARAERHMLCDNAAEAMRLQQHIIKSLVDRGITCSVRAISITGNNSWEHLPYNYAR